MGERYRVSENNNTVLLNLHHVTRNDVGHYTLTAKNSAGEARRAFQIKVEDAGSDVPVFLRKLSDLAVKVGTRTRFLVEIRSSSEVKVSLRSVGDTQVRRTHVQYKTTGSAYLRMAYLGVICIYVSFLYGPMLHVMDRLSSAVGTGDFRLNPRLQKGSCVHTCGCAGHECVCIYTHSFIYCTHDIYTGTQLLHTNMQTHILLGQESAEIQIWNCSTCGRGEK